MRQLGDAQDPDSPLPRFAIANLRATFRNIPADDLPLRRQELLETASLAAARAELENAAQLIQDQGLKQVADSQRLQRGKLQAWMWQWSKDLSARLAKDIEALEKKTSDPNNKAKAKAAADTDLLLYLRLLSPEKMALVTILEVMRSSGAGGIADGLKTLRGLIQVGKAIETEYRAATIQNMLGKDSRSMFAGGVQSGKDNQRAVNRLWQQVGKASTTSEKANEADKQRIANLDHSHAMEVLRKVWTPDWTQQKHVAVGAVLMNALVDTAKIERTMTDEDGVVQYVRTYRLIT
jgi:DNA-directed RNA polymerase